MNAVIDYTGQATVDEVGIRIRATFVDRDTVTNTQRPLDLRSSTVTFLFRRPGGTVEEVATTLGSARNVAEYVVPEGFLDEVGAWEWQAKVVGDATWLSERMQLIVSDHLTPTA